MKTSSNTLKKGDRVSLDGLRTSRLNGKRGFIVSLPDSSNEGRYGVRIDGSKNPVAIKPANVLSAAREASKEIQEDANAPVLLQKGDCVTLVGLEASAFNGRRGIIVSLSDPSNESRYGIRINGTRKPMGVKPTNIQLITKSTLDHKQQQDVIKNRENPTKDECLNADQMAAFRMLMTTALTEEQQIKLYGRKIHPVPDFRLEMINKGGGFPKGVSHAWANAYLRQAYEEDSASPHMKEVHFKMPDYEPSKKDLVRRVKDINRSKFEWYFGGRKAGDIFEKKVVSIHADCLRYSFSNQSYRKEVFQQGKTHVAIGFVDLGILMASDVVESGVSPLRFVGVDSSPYAVAKTLLIWELIKYSGSTEDIREKPSFFKYIAQVWFSTTWSKGTEFAVKSSLSSLLSSTRNKFDTEVRSILQHWHDAPSMPLKDARAKLQSLKSIRSASVGMLKKQRDRIAMANYLLTGDFCVRDPICGNIVLLDCPDGTPPPSGGETVFSALNFMAVMKIANENPTLTIVDAAERNALAGITKLVSWCSSDRITVELKCSTVQDAIDEIASMKPWTMSWSNVLDYIDHHEFHRMARECSKHGDTLHFGYSMNWPADVFGTCLIDFAGSNFTELRKELLETSNKAIRTIYCALGWESYFRFPLRENPINTTAKLLEGAHYQKWTDYFFSYARRDGLSCQVGNVEYSTITPLSKTGGSAISFTWTYDPEVSFHKIETPDPRGWH